MPRKTRGIRRKLHCLNRSSQGSNVPSLDYHVSGEAGDIARIHRFRVNLTVTGRGSMRPLKGTNAAPNSRSIRLLALNCEITYRARAPR